MIDESISYRVIPLNYHVHSYLSVPFETNIGKAHDTNINRYFPTRANITDNGYDCTLIAVEVGSRGLIDADNKNRLTRLIKQLEHFTNFPHFKVQLSKVALLSSYAIFNIRYKPTWNVQEFTYFIFYFLCRHDFFLILLIYLCYLYYSYVMSLYLPCLRSEWISVVLGYCMFSSFVFE